MSKIRISGSQKNAMMTIHLIELQHGLHTPVHTSFLRKKVDLSLCKVMASNHFLVALKTLAENGYLVFQPNTGQSLNASAKENENMWH